jgi:ABC-type oligopeptide transport system substrate-binding subunit
MTSFNDQCLSDFENSVDAEERLSEEIENLAIWNQRKGGEFDPFNPENFREALEECTDYEALYQAVIKTEQAFDSMQIESYNESKQLTYRTYIELIGIVKNYWNELAMSEAAREIEGRTE